MEVALDKKRSRSSSGDKLQHKKRHIEELILNYGIEIEATFELLNEYTAYNQFINFYINYSKHNINASINSFIQILKLCLDKHDSASDIIADVTLLKDNDIYKQLIPEDEDEDKIRTFLTTNLNELVVSTGSGIRKQFRRLKENEIGITSKTKQIINNWYTFLNISIKIIKYSLDKTDLVLDTPEIINILLNIHTTDNVFTSFENIFDLTIDEKIKLYDINDIQNFYKTVPEDDEICLCLTSDCSVICDSQLLYNNIISGEIITKYHYLLNNCEFITQPFKTIDDIKKKLPIFFDLPKIKNTLLNCVKTSQHVHISFNNSAEIIQPNIYLLLTILCVCHYFQDDIFKLFLITRTNNMYCKQLNFNNGMNNRYYEIRPSVVLYEGFEDDSYDDNLINIFHIFYDTFETPEENHNNIYYWLNLVNLFGSNNNKPYTIEFRLKHGSTDAEELGNVCKLYENIINYSNELLDFLISNSLLDTAEILDIRIVKDHIYKHITDNKEFIFTDKILKDIKEYFTDPRSNYVIGLNKLNKIFKSKEDESRSGGSKQILLQEKISNIPKNISLQKNISLPKMSKISKIINDYRNKSIYKMNSFGFEYIGKGLNPIIINNLETKFNSSRPTNTTVQNYLNLHNIFIEK